MWPFGEFDYKSEVLNLKLRKDYVVAVLIDKIYIYALSELTKLETYATCQNQAGLVALSPNIPNMNTCVLAFPSTVIGSVIIVDFSHNDKTPKKLTVKAHENEIA